MSKIQVLIFTVFIASTVMLVSCGTKQPVTELKEAQAELMMAKQAGAETCAPELISMAESEINSGKSQIQQFSNELRAKRTLVDARAHAMEARLKCRAIQ